MSQWPELKSARRGSALLSAGVVLALAQIGCGESSSSTNSNASNTQQSSQTVTANSASTASPAPATSSTATSTATATSSTPTVTSSSPKAKSKGGGSSPAQSQAASRFNVVLGKYVKCIKENGAGSSVATQTNSLRELEEIVKTEHNSSAYKAATLTCRQVLRSALQAGVKSTKPASSAGSKSG